jgi:hypothetical protein
MARAVGTASGGFPQIRSHLHTRSAACAPTHWPRRDPGIRQCSSRQAALSSRQRGRRGPRAVRRPRERLLRSVSARAAPLHKHARSAGLLHDESVPARDLLHQLWRRAVHLVFIRVHEKHVAHLSLSFGTWPGSAIPGCSSPHTRTTFEYQRIDSSAQGIEDLTFPSVVTFKSTRTEEHRGVREQVTARIV